MRLSAEVAPRLRLGVLEDPLGRRFSSAASMITSPGLVRGRDRLAPRCRGRRFALGGLRLVAHRGGDSTRLPAATRASAASRAWFAVEPRGAVGEGAGGGRHGGPRGDGGERRGRRWLRGAPWRPSQARARPPPAGRGSPRSAGRAPRRARSTGPGLRQLGASPHGHGACSLGDAHPLFAGPRLTAPPASVPCRIRSIACAPWAVLCGSRACRGGAVPAAPSGSDPIAARLSRSSRSERETRVKERELCLTPGAATPDPSRRGRGRRRRPRSGRRPVNGSPATTKDCRPEADGAAPPACSAPRAVPPPWALAGAARKGEHGRQHCERREAPAH